MMQNIKLIVTDLDGTLIGNDNEFAFCSRLSELLGEYRSKCDTVWAICSGRHARSVRESVETLHQMGLDPDYVIVRNAFVYATGRHDWHPKVFWNVGIRLHMIMSFFYLKSSLRDWQREINRTFKNVICVYEKRNRFCLRFRNREDADKGAEILRRKAKVYSHLRVYQYLSEVEVRSITYTKGMAVEELAGRLGIKRSETLCIGNGASDLSMLDGTFATMTGCPSNAEMDIIDEVHRNAGYIAEGKSMEGVVEILEGYLAGRIQSDYPSWWSPTHVPKHPRVGQSRLRRPPRQPIQASQRVAIQIGLLSAYAVLVVFASFNLIPFSHIIMKPFTIVAGWVQWLLDLIM